MIAKIPAAVMAALLATGTAAAQNTPADRPALGQPQSQGQTQARLGAAEQAALSQLARDVMAAQQVGYLAADKNMQAGYALLGDQMALVNSQLNRSLDKLAADADLNLPRVMDQQDRQRFEQMKGQNKDQFAQSLLRFIDDTYPRMLGSIDTLARQMPNSDAVSAMARDSAPRLRDQMRSAQQLAQGRMDQQSAESDNRGPIQRKDDPAVIPDTTPR